MDRIRMTEHLDLDVEEEMWHCHRCGRALIWARENYKKGCLVYNRDPRETATDGFAARGLPFGRPDIDLIVELGRCPILPLKIQNLREE